MNREPGFSNKLLKYVQDSVKHKFSVYVFGIVSYICIVMNASNKMTPKELALLDQMQRLHYSHGLITTALSILRQSREAQDEMLLYMYEKNPSERKFVERLAAICATDANMQKQTRM